MFTVIAQRTRRVRRAALGTLLVFPLTGAFADVPILQPGAPGEASRAISPEDAIRIATTTHSPDDTRFMQDMIPHHHQAVEMSALVSDRTNNPELIDVAGRIDAAQGDEIAFMQEWLRERGESVPQPEAHHAMHTSHEMAGMATPEQMAELAAARGAAFDKLFLQLMITHHEGAVKMVEDLLEQPGSAYDPVLFDFTSEITSSQTAEIERMNTLLVGLSSDPRSGLQPGLENAGEAIWNLGRVASLPRPPGFFDPENPGEIPGHLIGKDPEGDEEETVAEDDKRYPMLSFSNTDMAFAGDVLVAGNYHGKPGGESTAGSKGSGRTSARIASAAYASSTSATWSGLCRWVRSRPAAARTRTRSLPVPATTDGLSSTCPAPRRCVRKTRCPGASTKRPATTARRCSALT
jgi:uncharacterized protein (DUF305 family)